LFPFNKEDWKFHFALGVSCLFGLLVVLGSFYVLVNQSIQIGDSHSLFSILFGKDWDPYSESYGLMPMLVGSFTTALGALLVAMPIAVLLSLFVVFQAPNFFRKILLIVMGILLAVPSVIYGLWGLSVFSPLFIKLNFPAMNLSLGVLVLSLMLIPTIMAILVFGLKGTKEENEKAACALQISETAKIFKLYLPSQKRNLVFAGLLGLAKALGETMAILMVSGNIPLIPDSLVSPVRSLTANVALEMAYAMDQHRSSLYLSGLVLMLGISLLAGCSYFLTGKQLEGSAR
jgi:phosphate transport system permease protein